MNGKLFIDAAYQLPQAPAYIERPDMAGLNLNKPVTQCPKGYVLNKCDVCLNPFYCYSFEGKRVYVTLQAAEIEAGKFGIGYELNVMGSDSGCGGSSSSPSSSGMTTDIKGAFYKHLSWFINSLKNDKMISSKNIRAEIKSDLALLEQDFYNMFSQQSLF